MFARLRYLFRRWWCAPRHAMTLHALLTAEQARVQAFHMHLMVNRVNRDWFCGFAPETLLVSETYIDRVHPGDGMAPARVEFAMRRGGWNRVLTEDGRLVRPDSPTDFYPADDFEGCFPESTWSELEPAPPAARRAYTT